MKSYLLISLMFVSCLALAQIDAGNVLGLPRADDLAQMNAIASPNPQIGALLYNDDDSRVYMYINDVDRWVSIDVDAQDAAQVPLNPILDVDDSGKPTVTNETTVQEAIEAIAPITSIAGRIFYPPSIPIDASVNGTFTVNLYDEYVAQYSGAGIVKSVARGVTAPDIPIYAVNELYYYVTFAEPTVFGAISIDGDTGIMTYEIIGRPADFNSLINVVFVVK